MSGGDTRSLSDIRSGAWDAQGDRAWEALRDRKAEEFEDTAPAEYRGHTVRSSLSADMRRLVTGQEHLLREFLSAPSQFALLQGTKGLGKSVLAVSMARVLIRRGHAYDGMWVSWPVMLHDFSWSQADDPVGKYAAPEVLVIDDLGAGTVEVTEAQRRALFDLVERRYSASDRKTTIFTSNLALVAGTGGLPELLSERGWDRITQSLTRLQFKGESLRLM